MLTIEKTTFQRFGQEAAAHGLDLPIEQTEAWARYQSTIDGRRHWGVLCVLRDGEPVAFLSLVDYLTHGYHYLRAMHGPVWLDGKPDAATELETLQALVKAMRSFDRNAAFLRLDTWYEDGTVPVLSTVPYDSTVVIDVTGGDEEILKRMKRRGRRDVRKSLRECAAECADETDLATADFSDYYAVMVETGSRDGFAPAPQSDYEDMIRTLGPDHCRVFAARLDGKVMAWSIVTVSGTHAVRYYAGMRSEAMRMHVTDKLLYTECCMLGARGVTAYDLMGIGSDFAPSLKGLNEFKTKFTEEITDVAPSRDVPVKTAFYGALRLMQSVRRRLRRRS
ncbi:lipid II:glycine glycyltransferase FemX [Bifidobacterium aesculapii]|uniref:lipid II:glycine glycyltransferase FemX n=1 Tax=Bifidobacterium aesculapii TaxID=1329411 RepID=UPI0006E46913|nr:GNAT family N-acetyltransferase [Bifidobacterium aesculapii]